MTSTRKRTRNQISEEHKNEERQRAQLIADLCMIDQDYASYAGLLFASGYHNAEEVVSADKQDLQKLGIPTGPVGRILKELADLVKLEEPRGIDFS